MTEYHTTATALADLVASKQIQYGDSATRAQAIAAILYPTGVSVGQYKDMLLVIRVIDKLSRIATSGDGTDHGGENPWQDIGGYALLGMARVRPAPDKKKDNEVDCDCGHKVWQHSDWDGCLSGWGTNTNLHGCACEKNRNEVSK